MEKIEKQRTQRIKEKISLWLKDKYNFIFVCIFIFALILYLYFFFLAKNQPLWWDEAEYILKGKNIALGTPVTGWAPLRPILFSLFAAAFYFVGLGEVSIRFFMIFSSLTNLILLYILGKDLFNKKIALITCFLFSVFYLNLFYTIRLLVNVPELTVGLLIFTLFYSGYYIRDKKKYLLFIVPLTIIGFALRFTALVYLVVIILFLLLNKGLGAFKIRNLNYSFLIALIFASPVFIYFLFKGSNPLSTFLFAITGTTFYRGFHTVIPVTSSYLRLIPSSLGWILFIVFLIGLVSFSKLFIMLDKTLFKNSKKYSNLLFIFIWFLVVITFYGGVIDFFDDRYFLMAFPAIFLICGKGLDILYGYGKKMSKYLSIFIIVILVLSGGYHLLNHSNKIIRIKLNTYDSVRDVGLWLKQNSNPDDIIISSSAPQNTYYGERETYVFPKNESDFPRFLEEKKPRYLVVSVWERSPEWTYSWPQRNNDTLEVVQAFTSKDMPGQATSVIYRFKNT